MNETCNVVTIRADDDELLQVLTYHLGNDVFAINVSQVKEVLRYKIIASINDTPEYVKGIINLRTKEITIINVHSLFGLVPEDITINTRIIIVEADGPYFGIVVDNIADVVYLTHLIFMQNIIGLQKQIVNLIKVYFIIITGLLGWLTIVGC